MRKKKPKNGLTNIVTAQHSLTVGKMPLMKKKLIGSLLTVTMKVSPNGLINTTMKTGKKKKIGKSRKKTKTMKTGKM